MNICVYTILTNDYDTVKPVVLSGIPHYLFTDNPNIVAKGWIVIPIEKTEDCRLQRKIKILGHPELDKYDVTIYIDASMTLRSTITQLLRTYKGGFVIGNHNTRNCVYAEGLAVKQLKKAPEEIVNKHIAEYYENNFPINFGMWSSGFMIRDKSTKAMCELWYSKLDEHSHRDQLSLPWALWKTGLKPQSVRYEQFVSIAQHKKKELPKIVSIQPWRTDKNLGLANNEEIAKCNDSDWIVLTDGDSCWVLPDWGTKIEQVIQDYGDKFDLIGCVVNRLGGLHQCYDNKFDTEVNGYNEWDKANDCWDKHGTLVEETTGVAGVCMIFKKSTWKKAGGFREKTITADTEFCKSVRKSGGKIGLAKGLYRMHLYRIWEKEHKKAHESTAHLR